MFLESNMMKYDEIGCRIIHPPSYLYLPSSDSSSFSIGRMWPFQGPVVPLRCQFWNNISNLDNLVVATLWTDIGLMVYGQSLSVWFKFKCVCVCVGGCVFDVLTYIVAWYCLTQFRGFLAKHSGASSGWQYRFVRMICWNQNKSPPKKWYVVVAGIHNRLVWALHPLLRAI